MVNKLYFLFSHPPFAIYKIDKICINKVKKLADIVDQRRTPWYFLLHEQEVPYVSAYRIHGLFRLVRFQLREVWLKVCLLVSFLPCGICEQLNRVHKNSSQSKHAFFSKLCSIKVVRCTLCCCCWCSAPLSSQFL